MVNVDNVKMSKSLGNFRTIRDLFAKYDGEVLRYFVISNHYRKPIDFSASLLDAAKNSYDRLKRAVEELKDDHKENKEAVEEFTSVMNDDLNTPKALASLWNIVRNKKATGKVNAIKEMDKVLGLKLFEKKNVEISEDIESLVKKRDAARKNKEWAESDRIRKELTEKGYLVEDTAQGTRVRKV
jgi:cysteinyl-tRNA synthetase